MTQFILWYFLISLLGFAFYPITRRIFRKAAAQGYFFSRIIALFIWGFFYWFLGSLNIIPVDINGALLVLLIAVFAIYMTSSKNFSQEYIDPLKAHYKAVITAEILFLAAFIFMTLLKSMLPNLDHTETPMEMAFLSAILRSDTFPPRDPWLSGYGISYYYFGYIIVSLLVRVTAVEPAVGFTLAVSLWYALAALVVYGISYQLLCDWRVRVYGAEAADLWHRTKGRFLALLAPLLMLFSGNLEGLLEIFYAKGWFWQTNAEGVTTSSFWKWIDITDLKIAPMGSASFIPNRSSWWWWQGSRVLGDYDIQGNFKEIIDEFPFFSFYLGDLHPHVLAIPFVLVVLALCYELFKRLFTYQASESIFDDAVQFFSDRANLGFCLFSLVFIGGIAFLNTWDFPIYFGLFMLVILAWRIHFTGWSSKRLLEIIMVGAVSALIAFTGYIPFFLSFSSQAGGFLPSLIYFTTGKQLWIFFGGLLIPIMIWLIWLSIQHGTGTTRLRGILNALGIWVTAFLFSMLTGVIGLSLIGGALSGSKLAELGSKIYDAQGLGNTHDILLETVLRRIQSPFGWITLVILFGFILSLFLRRPAEAKQRSMPINHETGFLMLVLLVAGGLIAFPEFFYLLDGFGWRMNTIFKFYYQAWLLLSICASFAIVVLFAQIKSAWKWVIQSGISILLVLVLIYPTMASFYRFVIDHNQTMSLDGAYHIRTNSPLEMDAIDWLRQAPDGVVVESVGGSYRPDFGKVSTYSGLQTILGWPGHEGQWRGGYTEVGSREEDVRRIYQLRNWDEARQLLDQYNVRYIYIGQTERFTYSIEESKFMNNLDIVFQNDAVTIYEYLPSQLVGKSSGS